MFWMILCFNLRQLFVHFNENMKFYRKIKKQVSPENLAETVKENKRATVIVAAAFLLFLYVMFNNNGIVARIQLEMEKTEALEQIRIAEEEEKKLKDQSKALDGDPKAVEKVAREKYGMVRENEKVYKVVPKK
jgi:cell division protein FtsB